MRARTALVLVAVLGLAVGACGKKSTEPKTTSTYAGTFAGSSGGTGVSGSMTVDLAGTPAGTLLVSGTSIALTGTYDSASEAVTLSGGGYSFSGTRSGSILSGIFTAPGPITGGFVLTSGRSVRVYCGTSASATPGGPTGTINLVITGSTIVGLAVKTQTGEVTVLNGTSSGSTVTILNPGDPSSTFATGTLNAGPDTLSGTYDDGAGDTGTWNATRC